ncbi:phage major capsid protein [Actinomyces sp. MRS3W]|uniref:phage major capsid protein n=1 Tax=Actinomyces sp. MRS3W TaxID=2800796 RepID=UPI0028FD9A58|nr:phage major capsid protein [Actinomyces sp. MRS3W]MDU0349238.1 phage major capsid protein [Actinomyces sp. MRS3W]
MAVFDTTTGKLALPDELAAGIIKRTQDTSVLARLSAREPMRFGKTDYLTFTDFPKAEFVEEGAEKAASTVKMASVTAVPHKAQVTVRLTEEVQWADEDYQLGVLRTISDELAVALSRALDLGAIHRINPLTGAQTTWDNYIAASTLTVVQDTADPDEDFRTAVGLLINSDVTPTGAAFDPGFSWDLANLKVKDGSGTTSQLRYPTLGFGTNVTDFMGLPVAQGDTVSAKREAAAATGVRAIVGDFATGFRWGLQRSIPVSIIRYGDPDGQGDLARKNEIALRAEAVYGWYAFTDRFALVKAA